MKNVLCWIVIAFGLAACAGGTPEPGAPQQVRALAARIEALSPDVDPAEAQRAATVAYAETQRLALAYEITDPPLIHNAKVNAGLRPRGLCYHWAEDLEARLDAEGFRTLQIERAIANAESRIRIEHSTAVITPRGARMEDGIVLDPWREGGRLFWSPVAEDSRYDWLPRNEALIRKGQVTYVQRTAGSKAPAPAVTE
jgi:hypothetical protein